MRKGLHEEGHSPQVPRDQRGDDRRHHLKTRSTWGKEGDTLTLEIDPLTHPAWTGGQQHLVDTGGQLSRFKRRFKDFSLEKEKK